MRKKNQIQVALTNSVNVARHLASCSGHFCFFFQDTDSPFIEFHKNFQTTYLNFIWLVKFVPMLKVVDDAEGFHNAGMMPQSWLCHSLLCVCACACACVHIRGEDHPFYGIKFCSIPVRRAFRWRMSSM